jgi:hypothetical protein
MSIHRTTFGALLGIVLCAGATGPASASEQASGGSSLPAYRQLPLPLHTATYDVYRQGTRLGTLDVRLTLDAGGVYEYSADTHATHLLARMMGVGAKERGRFLWNGDEIRPIYYEQFVSRPGPNRFWHANFDWENEVANGRSHRSDFATGLKPSTLDPLTVRLQLAAWLDGDDDARAEYAFSVLDRNEIEQQVIERRETFTLQLAVGCVRTVHFALREEDPRRGDHMWLAPALHWLPVRLQQIRDGRELVEMRLARTSLPVDDPTCAMVPEPR